jgi:hypothetical protein
LLATIARLATGGAEYTRAQTPDPSDSDPAGTGLMTGGDPKGTGIYYDVEYSHGVFPAGTATCPGAVPGGDVIYDSPDDKLPAVADLLHNKSGNTFPSFDEGGSIYPGGVDANPAKIMNLSPHPQSGLNPATYPVDPKTCQPIQPWDFLGVNSIFQVIHNAGLRTAWSDKHAIYTSFNGPGSNGMSIDDFFGPEIDSQAVEPNGVPYPDDGAWTDDNAATKQYDSYKVQAVVNWINGHGHAGTGPKVGTPAIYGMNFQVVQHSGLREIFAGQQSARFFGVSKSDPHHPDVFGIAQAGTIYTTGSKIAEHGGDNPGDRDVPLVVYAPGTVRPGQAGHRVETTQVAPTILKLLGLSPGSLQAVKLAGTHVLPGL